VDRRSFTRQRGSLELTPISPPAAGRAVCVERVGTCVGGYMCLHRFTEQRDEAYFAAACTYDYDRSSTAELRRTIETQFLAPRFSLTAIAACGGSVALLGFARVTLLSLVTQFRYTLEQVLNDLGITEWAQLLVLGFQPELLRHELSVPVVVLYDRLRMRAQSLYSFARSAPEIEAALPPNAMALLDIDLTRWK
jgi:hypothetical protein